MFVGGSVFSSRRRHTRWTGDWSSDVCSSDLVLPKWLIEETPAEELKYIILHEFEHLRRRDDWTNLAQQVVKALLFFVPRSEERRVGKEGGAWGVGGFWNVCEVTVFWVAGRPF